MLKNSIFIKSMSLTKDNILIIFILIPLLIAFELLSFNKVFFATKAYKLKEVTYSINDGAKNQFKIENEKLISQSDDPNLILNLSNGENIKVSHISIKCTNTNRGSTGQIFYRSKEEKFNEINSTNYKISPNEDIIFLRKTPWIPETISASELRLDLTNTKSDQLSCSNFKLNKYEPFYTPAWRITLYILLILISISINKNFTKEEIIERTSEFLHKLSKTSDAILIKIEIYTKENSGIITILCMTATAAYGFELFNLNLTIDEELHAFFTGPTSLWIGERRWGMYLLNKYLLPYTIIPLAPLLLALTFHIAGILLILNCWEVRSKLDQVVSGTLMLTFPTLAYIYMFSTLNFGIGIGFFCIALSIFFYKKNEGYSQYWMVVPAIFAISIYQAFAVAISVVFIVHLTIEAYKGKKIGESSMKIASAILLSLLIYHLIQNISLHLLIESSNEAETIAYKAQEIQTKKYFSFIFDTKSLQENITAITKSILTDLLKYYSGQHENYIVKIKSLGLLIAASILGCIIGLKDKNISTLNKILIPILLTTTLVLPFSGALLSNGYILTRSLLALPIATAGVFIIGAKRKNGITRISILLLTLFIIFQFITSINRLFGSSHLALQADKIIASRLMERIDEVKLTSGIHDPTYLEVVGKFRKNDTQATPRRDTFGISFFELTNIGQPRIASFLGILGYQVLRSLPPSRLAEFVGTAEAMPIWPANGSIKIINDTVVMKFGEYPAETRLEICTYSEDVILPEGFCPPTIPNLERRLGRSK